MSSPCSSAIASAPSVRLVWRPAALHSVSPWRTSSTEWPARGTVSALPVRTAAEQPDVRRAFADVGLPGDLEAMAPGHSARQNPRFAALSAPQIRERSAGWDLWRDGCPGGETAEQVGARADRVIARAVAAEGDVAVFAHGHLLRVLGARWIGLPAAAGGNLGLDTATLCELGFERKRRAVWLWNG